PKSAGPVCGPNVSRDILAPPGREPTEIAPTTFLPAVGGALAAGAGIRKSDARQRPPACLTQIDTCEVGAVLSPSLLAHGGFAAATTITPLRTSRPSRGPYPGEKPPCHLLNRP